MFEEKEELMHDLINEMDGRAEKAGGAKAGKEKSLCGAGAATGNSDMNSKRRVEDSLDNEDGSAPPSGTGRCKSKRKIDLGHDEDLIFVHKVADRHKKADNARMEMEGKRLAMEMIL